MFALARKEEERATNELELKWRAIFQIFIADVFHEKNSLDDRLLVKNEFNKIERDGTSNNLVRPSFFFFI